MKYKFAFEKLLVHRKITEDRARKEFLLAQAKVDGAEGELKKMYDDVTNAHDRVGRLQQTSGQNAASLMVADEFIVGQKIRIQHQREKIRQLLAVAEEKRAILIEAAREKKTLEKLKEKRFEEFKRTQKKREMREIDEIVTMRFKREAN